MVQEEVPLEDGEQPCSVWEAGNGSVRLISMQQMLSGTDQMPETIQEVLEGWGNGWLWCSLRMTGTYEWMVEAICNGTLRAVTDGSYIKEMHPELCLAAFVLECSQCGGRMIGSFPELSPDACAYQGEMLGLLALHLILLAVNKLHRSWTVKWLYILIVLALLQEWLQSQNQEFPPAPSTWIFSRSS